MDESVKSCNNRSFSVVTGALDFTTYMCIYRM